MKLIQRIALRYYATKFKVLEAFSPQIAAEAAFHLLCTPYTKRKYTVPPTIFKIATELSFNIGNESVKGFKWTPERNDLRLTILICHGFDSSSYRFDDYINPLLNLGFTVLAFDAPAHGLSTGKTINAQQYRDVILKINELYGPIHGTIAHSFGGIAVALAVEQFENNHHKRLVLIAPATETTRSINTFFQYISVSAQVRKKFDELIEKIGGNPASWFSVARVIQQISTPTLWLHDREDTVTPFEDMEHLINKKLPHLKFEITTGLGHSGIYKEPDIQKKIISFLSEMKD